MFIVVCVSSRLKFKNQSRRLVPIFWKEKESVFVTGSLCVSPANRINYQNN